ncbi:helix-hairpin-helix domain-containing protein [Shewanella mesophila]|uniref:ComEA family DNA-binding protein n=1 Tax=Shewanella mesophila TaxID=2864208 RepID=UPI001C65A677|nr:ComEA family DNA-binding protein [Shewanella mesophila]QYJ87422.1 helix-hairpin-helix domain-containing protein [Shewanella mesophila]
MKVMLLTAVLSGVLAISPLYAAEKINAASEQVIPAQININTATAEELVQLKGIGQSKALAIIEYRDANGKFNSIEELSQVKGIGSKLLEQNRAKLTL